MIRPTWQPLQWSCANALSTLANATATDLTNNSRCTKCKLPAEVELLSSRIGDDTTAYMNQVKPYKSNTRHHSTSKTCASGSKTETHIIESSMRDLENATRPVMKLQQDNLHRMKLSVLNHLKLWPDEGSARALVPRLTPAGHQPFAACLSRMAAHKKKKKEKLQAPIQVFWACVVTRMLRF